MRFAVAVGLVLALASGTASAVPQAIPAHHGRLSLPTAGKFAPLLHRRFVAKCRMDHCQWLRLDGSRLIGRSATGELYAVKQRWWHSGPHKTYRHAGPIKEASERGGTGYVFCSKTKPAVIGTDGKTAYQIYPGSRSVACVSETVYVLYWAACHRSSTPEAGDDTNLARRFGYNVVKPSGASTLTEVTLGSVEETLSW